MRCPFCSSSELKVIDKRVSDDESNRRRRECLKCGKRFTTYERVEMIEIKVVKKDGRREPFNRDKILKGLLKACEKRPISEQTIQATLDDIESEIMNSESQEFKSTDIGEVVMKHLRKVDEIAYIRFASVYREFKDLSQFESELSSLKVISSRQKQERTEGVTELSDSNLVVTTPVKGTISEWNRERITEALVKEIKLQETDAQDIAKAVESKVLRSGVKTISTSLLRELVNNELFERGMTKKLEKQEILGLSVYNLNQIIFSKVEEKGLSNNPEAVNLAIAEQVLKNYALKEVFSKDVVEAHLKGAIHLHDLGHVIRLYSAIYSLEYIKKYGLKLSNLNTESTPAKYAQTLTGHLNTFLASMQAYYSGSIGIEYLNIFYAPLLTGKGPKELKQEAQNLIFGCNQNAFLRGGQALSIDFNIYLTIPRYLENTPAIGEGGKYILKRKNGKLEYYDAIPKEYLSSGGELKILGDSSNNEAQERFLTYKDFEKETQSFAKALIEVWEEGDANKKSFTFPRMHLHLSQNKSTEEELLKYACKVAQSNATPHFIFEREDASSIIIEKTKVSKTQKTMMNPESLRNFGLQNVILNLPRCAYKGKTNDETLVEIKKLIDIAIKANLQKKAFITKISNTQGTPLWQLEMKAEDEQKYADINNANYIISTVGLNECVKYLTGKEMHETEDSLKLGLKIISAIYLKLKELEKVYNLKIILEQEYPDSPALRMAKIDEGEYPESKTVLSINKKNEPYYTESIKLSDNSEIQSLERVEQQGKFDLLVESRTITTIKLGKLKQEEIYTLIKDAFQNTTVKCVKFEK